ncbi:hypothetical protein CFC21_021213 [Triticum aestivum]|uniref:Leucine-rich repeat-containing N-terminal plant-type domain-containing protein n=3 Tax=Triticum TaxID=4564 RepID=A0A9R1PE04_TRITD|nr:receptor-like protein 15 [Triticum dicoccoides]KAF7006148.1 hypothetical protein CFC21_021213 [Triticum aestivum]VAH41060.1 unnamed protein product [Triticum turgidum subsp. durum]
MVCYLLWRCLFLVLCGVCSMFQSSSGCFMEERAALMDIRSWLVNAESKAPTSWGDGGDCCSWERITCDNTTHRLSHLNLFQTYQENLQYFEDECPNFNLTIFSSFRGLQLLNFSGHHACLQNFEGLQGLSKLKYLDLSYNSFQGGGIPGSVGKLVSLEVINLNGNNIGGTLHSTDFSNLRNLRELHLGSSQLKGSLPASIFALPRLEYLDLSYNLFEGHIPINLSRNLRLRELYLTFNRLSGGLPTSLFALPRLEYLDLSDNLFQGHILTNSSWNLRALHLGSNQLSGTLPASVFALPCLEYLDLSYNLFKGHIHINSSWNLRELHLRSNQLSGRVPGSVFALSCLEYLDLSENLLQGHIPISSSWKCTSSLHTIRLSDNRLSGQFDFFWLRNCAKLKEIDLSRNTDLVIQVQMHGWVPKFQLNTLRLSWCNLDKSMITEPHFLHTQNHLQFLDLSNNNLPGSMPNWLFTNKTTLVYLNLANNSLVGSLDLIGQPQTNLKQVNVSLNLVEGQLPANIGFMFPHLIILDVSRNTISGTIPPALCNSSIQLMDLSNNRFTGKVPACLFTDCYAMNILKLSNNTLGGKILDGASSFSGDLWAIHLGNNKFEGTLPRNLSGNVQIMDLHDNKMSGELDTSLWCLPSLQALSLANNGLTGGIHPEISTLTNLMMLDLSGNYFTGRLPNCDTMVYLTFLSVSGNSLSGSPGAFFNSSYITALDLSNNQFTGNLEWAQHLSQVSVLLLSRNKFEGHISSNLCHLQHLSIIDVSHNKLSGSVPPCIGGIPFEPIDPFENWPAAGSITYGGGEYGADFVYNNNYDLPGFTFTTKGHPYTYGQNFFMSMSGIDFSSNMLSGEIPKEMGNLSHIKSLNLSNNFLTGPIPATLANMSEIESLDLSKNRLNGLIPWQLTRLSSLEVFSVAYNNLSGCLPDSGQFGSFDTDCYRGNNNLRSCTSSSGHVAWNGTAGSVPDDSDPILYVVAAVSFVLAFWATISFVFCHSFGRRVILKLW